MAQVLVRTFDHVDDVGEHELMPRGLGAVVLDWTAERLPGSVPAIADDAGIRDRIVYRCALVVVDGDHRIRDLEVNFVERVMAAGRSLVMGSDRSGSFSVRLESDLPPTALRIRFTYQQSPRATPDELLPVIEFLEALHPSRALGLWSPSSERWAADPVPIPNDCPRLPEGYASTVTALARVQRLTHRSFPMPDPITDDDAASIRRADLLLAGSIVTGRWHHAGLVIDPEGLALVRSASQEHGALLEFTSDHAEKIGGHTVSLGPAEHRLFQVLVDHTEPAFQGSDETLVHLVPGDNDRFERRLIAAGDPPAVSEARRDRRRLFAAAGLLSEADATSAIVPDPAAVRVAELEAGEGQPLADFIIESRT